MRPGFNPWIGKIPWRREQLSTPVFRPGELKGLYSLWGLEESNTLSDFHFTFNILLCRILNILKSRKAGKCILLYTSPIPNNHQSTANPATTATSFILLFSGYSEAVPDIWLPPLIFLCGPLNHKGSVTS